jgi:hypothetical protein
MENVRADLNDPNASGYTTEAEEDDDDEFNGGKRLKKTTRKNKKHSKSRKYRKSRKQKGGVCYGNGIGANNYDPNFSIYNTRELQLFPYNSTK